MYKGKSVVTIVPAYNEETQIGTVIETMPDIVDKIVIVDDQSSDKTVRIVKHHQARLNGRLHLIEHLENQGVGGSIATGYKYARDTGYDLAVVMAGDGQMDNEDLPSILEPVATEQAEYSKGNRLFTGEAFSRIPKVRYFGNSLLSLFTKIASGYWHIADSQSGYTAISKKALQAIEWDKMYKNYGQPNDLLVRLNVHNFRVQDVLIKPVYHVGEASGIRIKKVVFTISWLLLKRFLWRLKEQYIIRDFHPLIFFYVFGFLFGVATLALSARLLMLWSIAGTVPPMTALAMMFSFMSATHFTLFAMWFDMEANKHLK